MEKLFSKYLNGTCTPSEFTKVVDLLTNSKKEDILSSNLRTLWRDIMSEDIIENKNKLLLEKIHHQIATKDSEIYLKRLTSVRNLLKVAAVLIIGLILSTIFLYNKSANTIARDVFETIRTPYGARSNFVLPDGTEVWLNSGSTLSYSQQKKSVREFTLSGQAFFNVSKNKIPFIVKTRYGDVEAKGTSFEIKAYSNDDFETVLVEGSIEIRINKGKTIMLKPGQQSIINSLNEISVIEVDTDLVTSWKDGKLVFVNEPFYKVVSQLERWYNVKIEVQGESLKNIRYTGKIEMETFSEILDLLNITTSIKYNFDTKTRIVKIYEQ